MVTPSGPHDPKPRPRPVLVSGCGTAAESAAFAAVRSDRWSVRGFAPYGWRTVLADGSPAPESSRDWPRAFGVVACPEPREDARLLRNVLESDVVLLAGGGPSSPAAAAARLAAVPVFDATTAPPGRAWLDPAEVLPALERIAPGWRAVYVTAPDPFPSQPRDLLYGRLNRLFAAATARPP